MKYKISYSVSVLKKFKKMDAQEAKRIVEYMQEIEKLDNPRIKGKQLMGNRAELWRYRVGDYRVICQIRDTILTVLIVEVGHRKEIYK